MKEKFFVSIILPLIVNILTIVSSYLLALFLDPDGLMGYWAYINTIISIGFLFMNVGFDYIHYQYSGKDNFDEYAGSYILIKLSLLGINFVLTLSVITVLGLWTEPYIIALLIMALSQVGLSFNNIFLAFLRAKAKIIKSELNLFIIKILKNALIIVFAINIAIFPDPLIILSGIYMLSEFLTLIVFVFISKNNIKINKPNKELILSYLKDTRPLIIVSVLFIITSFIGNIIIDFFYGKEDLAYFYVINVNIITILINIILYLRPLMSSIYAKSFENNDISSIKSVTYTIERYASILYLLIIIVVLLNADLIFSIFLPSYLPAVPILYVMIFSPYFAGLMRPYFFQLIPGKLQKKSAFIEITGTLLGLILIIVLIPQNIFSIPMFGLGTIGYALALTIPRLYMLILSRYYSYKYFNIKSKIQPLYHLAIAGVSFLLGLLLKIYLFSPLITNDILLLMISSIIPIGLFFILLIYFKFLKREDLTLIIDLFKVKTYTDSIKEEFKATDDTT